MTDTTPVPDDLLARIAAASAAGTAAELRYLATELPVPTPPPSTLRIIDVAQCTLTIDRVGFGRTTRTAEFPAAYMDRVAAQPDPMTVIEQQAKEWWRESDTDIDALLHRIRAALEGATQ
ncbi:hypothetical protein [Curtobacterium sp. MEB011]|uniref:hypothetical protein n=1 Tax=Curtobacterium sp. MEB011 TaxID=3040285 RepID=UPI00254E3609|nr:hypothetical protein [Curtobacterium sp. MEB011]